MNTRELYKVFTKSEHLLITKYTSIPIYAIRLLLYLDMHPNCTMSDLTTEFKTNISAIHRAVNEYLPTYVHTDTAKKDGVKRPINVYALTTTGQYFLEYHMNCSTILTMDSRPKNQG